MIKKVAMIAIVGRPNVGKSTLTNLLTGDKVAIVTPKPQTTRNRIFGVFSYEETQMILLDTPGFHKARTRLGDYMVGVVKESIANVDAAALIVEPIDNIGTQEEILIEQFSKSGIPAILAINKTDTIKPAQILPIINRYSQRFPFEAILPISAKTGDGIPQLLEVLKKYSKEGPQLFPDDMTTDQPEKQIIAEIIREKLLICLDKEIPHGTAVEITKFTERFSGSEDEKNEYRDGLQPTAGDECGGGLQLTAGDECGDGLQPTVGDECRGGLWPSAGVNSHNVIIDIDATIYCEKTSHKGMIIGKNGSMLKKVGQLARIDIEAFMGAKVFLQTWVKVKENWRDNQKMISNLIAGRTKY